MQYAPTLSRDALVDLAIRRYFASVDAKDLTAVLDCFNAEAILTVQTSFAVHAGKPAIERMFADLFATWDSLVHKDFTLTVDTLNGRIAAAFEAVLTDMDGAETHLFNTNFWRLRAGGFRKCMSI